MEVKMWAFINTIIFIFLIKQCNTEINTRTTGDPITFKASNDGTTQCKTKLHTCKLKMGMNVLPGRNGAKGESGEKGDKGLQGLTGNTGPKGDRGDRGMDGLPGSNGDPGEKGDQGLPGSPGDTGPKSDRGDRGMDGLTGRNGNPGEKGDQGPQGSPGNTGPKGVRGDRGMYGLPGTNGTSGEKGDQGQQGFPGDTGPKGDRGDRGMDGLPSRNGDPGKKGDQGQQGFPGDTGPKGDRGDRGMDGLPGTNGTSGEKGDQGQQGFHGDTGPKGDRGDRGMDGLPGRNGDPGKKGDQGQQGPLGNSGPKGDSGDRGMDGLPGTNGTPGEKGDQGPQGPSASGIRGPPGAPGLPGVCSCEPDDKSDDYPNEGVPELGDISKPSNLTCKYIHSKFKKGQIFYFYPKNHFMGYCDELSTCIKPERLELEEIKEKSIKYKYVDKKAVPFWLTEQGVNVNDLYKLTGPQVAWLQKQSVSANMTLRFHCKNSNPFPKTNTSNAMKMLTWSDQLIGPYPSETTPFFYSMKSEGCEESENNKSEWYYSDITLISFNVNRLPIQDFYIRDIRNGEQRLYIELIELCFT